MMQPRRAASQSQENTMKPTTFPVSAIAVSAVLLVVGGDAAADYRCDREHLTRVEATACAKAGESITALRHYVTLTKSMYDLEMRDFVPVAKQPDRAFIRSAGAGNATGPAAAQDATAQSAAVAVRAQPR
jgi:hypothetical protein